MNIDIVTYRAIIGLFNTVKFKCGIFLPATIFDILTWVLTHIRTFLSQFLLRVLSFICFPFFMAIFLILNLLPFRFHFPVLGDFNNFQTTMFIYLQISLKFVFIVVSCKLLAILSKVRACAATCSFSVLLGIASMLALLILQCGDVQINPGPLTFCHWNLRGLTINNFMKKSLLQAFLSVNNFDIIILGETHLTSKIADTELDIEGYSFKRCDHPDDDSRGGIGIYHKTSLPCIFFKPELTNLYETLVLQVKVSTKKCFI